MVQAPWIYISSIILYSHIKHFSIPLCWAENCSDTFLKPLLPDHTFPTCAPNLAVDSEAVEIRNILHITHLLLENS